MMINLPSPQSFTRTGTNALQYPVLISVPHAGRSYPPAIWDNLLAPRTALVRLEDRYSDLLARSAAQAGIAVMVAHLARGWIDLNRHPKDCDPASLTESPQDWKACPGPKARGGLGIIPHYLGGVGHLWRRPWVWSELQHRIDTVHAPYHNCVASCLDRMRQTFGGAILIDLHSMPSLKPLPDGRRVDIVIGDQFGRSAGSRLSALAQWALEQQGLAVALNHPYAGGYILERHGAPAGNVHAIQIEVDRALYLDVAQQEPGPGLQRVAEAIRALAITLAAEIMPDAVLAAE
jgi:N-formylglutamate amidohydrolase